MSKRRGWIFYGFLVVIGLATLLRQNTAPHINSDVWKKLIACKVDRNYLKGRYEITYTPEIQQMNGQSFSVSGFILPLEATERFTHFLLSFRTPSCPFCPPGAPNEIVEVFSKSPMKWSEQPVSMRGTLRLASTQNDTGVFFQMLNAEKEYAQKEDLPKPASQANNSSYSFIDLNNKPVTLNECRGKPVLIAFWRSDCAPCLKELEILPDIAKQNPDLSIILISLQDAEHTRTHLKTMPNNVRVLIAQGDGKQILSSFGNERVLALPYSAMLGVDGKVCAKHYGILAPGKIKEWQKQCSPND